ncbi:hypothetical protein GCM10023185_07110 [Hymenobacter saemangeumensis]|uniref:Uncharacterized protein n=1 Tax=Hymenobacter saemangeumensis TaxID=1084522 RepID=A0ABP8I2I2_9BACT
MNNLRILSLYLAAGIPVEHKAHGRGILKGLPFCQVPTERAVAEVAFDPPNAMGMHDIEDVANVVPVLYDLADLDKVLNEHPDTGYLFDLLGGFTDTDLQHFALVTDTVRALGVALNIPEGSYTRRALPAPPEQLSLFNNAA